MSIFIHGMEMPGQGEFSHVRIYGDGDVTVELSDGTEAVIGHAYAAGFDTCRNNPQKRMDRITLGERKSMDGGGSMILTEMD